MVGDEGFTDPPAAGPEEPRPPAEAAPAPRKPPEPGSYTLKYPVTVPARNGERLLTEVPCRRPTGMDLLQVGNPVIFDPASNPPRITHDYERMPNMLFRLTGLTPPELQRLTAEDIVGLSWHVTPFLMPGM